MKPLVQPDSPFVTRPESTYKSGIVVQTTGATSIASSNETTPLFEQEKLWHASTSKTGTKNPQ
jgi:hypothetical protein